MKSSKKVQSISEKSKLLSLFLRVKARLLKKPLKRSAVEPFYFYVDGYNGKHPVFIFSSFPCSKYMQGFCTPCLYSNIVHSTQEKKVVYESLLVQAEYIINNFDNLITKKQNHKVFKNLYKKFPKRPLVTFELCGEGSFLANPEIPSEYRWKIINLFYNYARQKKINMQVLLETKVADFLGIYQEFENKKEIIKDLNLTLIFGFESVNEITRNVIYNKGMDLADFERAVKIAHSLGLRTGAFLFCGFYSMTQREIVEDVRASVSYLSKKNTSIYLMLPNLQPYTINHLLFTSGRYNLLEPRTVVELVKIISENSLGTKSSFYFNGYNWNIGGLTTYPQPELLLFSNHNFVTCDKCTCVIKNALNNLVVDYKIAAFLENIKKIDNCSCKLRYQNFVLKEENNKIPLIERVRANVDFCQKIKDEYIEKIKAI
ncbi:MAG: hypothetical protein NTW11_01935 [Candidatus Staskawiczbacteria bacterium]|nr:hypothetical protein [Candidatus Staskawiczbacteria bacterium]